MMRLIFNSGPQAGTEIATAAALLRIGSDPQQNDVVLEDSQAAQRHCLLQRSPRGLYVLEDLGSQHGTVVNGKVVQNLGRPTAIYLSAGDRFQVGETEIEIGEGRARLMVTNGNRAGFELPLDEHAVTIGRAPDNVLDFEEPDVSVYHAALLSLPTGFTIQDNGSTNGTFVNGHRVERHTLADGDIITVGSNDLRFLVEVTDSPRERPAADAAGQQASAIQLVFVAGPQQGMTVPIVDDQITFGRRQTCTVVLDDMQASGMHCGITRMENGELHVTDLQSTNGTVINGVRITETTRINPGDLLEIGSSVLELRVTGGIITEAGLTTAMTTVIAEGAYEATSQPKFVIDGHVESTHEITLGRSPGSSILLDGRGVSSTHAVIKWEDGFYLEDKSTYGTYLNDRRIVREKLFTGHVIRVGEHMIDVQVRGERCTLDRIDRATAMAAIEVHREAQVDLAQAVPDQANSSAATGNAYKTVFNLQLPDVEAMIQERKSKFKEGAPAWRPSTDINQGSVGKVAVFASLIASVAVAGVLLGTAQADVLINHPLSEAHASQAFVDQADELGIDSGCAACHSAGNGVPQGKCTACHEGFAEVRAAHVGDGKDGRTPPGSSCIACHTEHQGMPRKNEHGGSTMLGAGATCAAESCHPNQHSDEFLKSGGELPLELEAGPVPTFDYPQEKLHSKHAQVKQAKTGKLVTIGCTACHAAKKDGALVEGKSGLSCFRCHQGGQEHVNSQCSSCHRDEHGAADLEQLPDDDPKIAAAVTKPSSGRSLLLGGALALAAFLPLAGLGLILRIRRRQRALQVVQHIHQFPVQTVKRLVHSINKDKCVGCSMCVQACPASVLELVNHKSTIVNFDACIQCKKCEKACAFDALRMHDADKPPPMIKMPDVDNYYETSVKGMYLIGQASGTPQVKNAINLGRAVVSHMVNMGGCAPGIGHQIGASYDVVIVGSGPAGLSAAASAVRAGLSYCLLEKQRAFSWTIRSYYHKGKPVMAEPNDVEMMGDIAHWDTVREDLLNSWEQSIQQYQIQIQYQADVTDVKKNGQIFEVITGDGKGNQTGSYTGARVVLAIGTMGNPRKLGCPGDDHEKVANALVDPDEYKGKNILVVGGTDSAIEVVLALCETNRVWLSVRSAKFDRVKPKNLEKIEKVIAEGKCTALFATVMKEVTDTTCTLEYKADKRQEQIPNDAVFAMIGGHPPTKFLEGIGVPYVEKPHSWSPPRTDELVKMTLGQS